MSNKYKSFGSDKFKARTENESERKIDTRQEKTVKEDLPKILISFKDFDVKQIPPGQNYEDWQDKKLLASMFAKFEFICGLNIVEAKQQGILKIYGDFPINTDFKHSQHIAKNVVWAVVMDIKGQKARVAGHIIGNVFYVVFLDKNHRFWISEKKNT